MLLRRVLLAALVLAISSHADARDVLSGTWKRTAVSCVHPTLTFPAPTSSYQVTLTFNDKKLRTDTKAPVGDIGFRDDSEYSNMISLVAQKYVLFVKNTIHHFIVDGVEQKSRTTQTPGRVVQSTFTVIGDRLTIETKAGMSAVGCLSGLVRETFAREL